MLLSLNFTAAYETGGGGGCNQVAIDAQGNTYVTGNFGGVTTFGNTQETGPLDSEAFVAKFSPRGTLDWFVPFANQDPVAGGDDADTLVLDAANQTVYVVGTFGGVVNFDPFPNQTGADLLTSSDGGLAADDFIVGLNESDGSVVNGNTDDPVLDDFAETYSDNIQFGVSAFPNDVIVDSAGDAIYVCGVYLNPAGYSNSLFLNPGSGNNSADLPGQPNGQNAGYILKFTSNLAIDWAANATDSSGTTCVAIAIASSAQNGIDYVVGSDDNSGDGFVEVLDDANDGNLVNSTFLTPSPSLPNSSVRCNAVATDSSGNAYVVGSFSGGFAPTSTAATLATTGQQNAFLVKFNPNLDAVWADRFGSATVDTANDVAIDGSGNVYFTGEDGGPSALAQLSASGQSGSTAVLRGNDTTPVVEAYVVEVSSSGTYVAGAQSDVSELSAGSVGNSIAVNASGQVAIVGSMTTPITLGGTSLTSATATGFIANLDTQTSTSSSSSSSSTSSSSPPPTPVFLGEHRIFSGRGKHKKVVGFEFMFSEVLDQAPADSTGNYRVVQLNGKHQKVIPVLAADYNADSDTVVLTVSGFKSNKSGQATIVGLTGADGRRSPRS